MAVLIRGIASEQRPRERLSRVGRDALSDVELLALLLRHGRAGESALEVAAGLLSDFGGLRALAQARPEELARRAGVGPAKAGALVAAFQLGRRVSEPSDPAPELAGPAGVAAAARSLCVTLG